MVDDGDLCAAKHFGILLRLDIGIAMNANFRVTRLHQPFENNRQRFVGVAENSAHWILRC